MRVSSAERRRRGDDLSEEVAQPNRFLARVLHAGHHDNAEGSALSEDLGQNSRSVSTNVQLGVCREHGELIDDQHVERVPGRRLVGPGDAGHLATAIVDDSSQACQDAQRFDRLGGHPREHA